jgi:aminopeptidase N
MYVWWMLRDMVGEPALKRALAAYRADQDKEPSYIQHLIETQSKRDLEWFFDDWVYRDRGLPDFRIESAYPRQILGGGFLVTVTVENLGGAGAEVPVTLRFQGGEVTKRLEIRGQARGVIRMEASSAPLEVSVNDGSVPESGAQNNSFKIQMGNN